jgi:putative transposase
MLSDQQLHDWFERLALSDKARQVIRQIRASEPARRVQGRRGNVRGCFPSRKMGHTIQYESRTNELSAIYLMEYYEADVLEYWDQPPSFTLRYPSKAGTMHGHLHTPDFFVLRQHSAGWEEWKMADELPSLAEKMPARYLRDDKGWRCPPGQEYARQFGLSYCVRTSAEINWELQRNLRFLEDYLRADEPDRWIRASARASVQSLLAAQPGITLRALCNGVQATTDEIYGLIAAGEIFVNLCGAPLAEPNRVTVYPDQDTAFAYAQIFKTQSLAPADGVSAFALREGTVLSWDGKPWRIVNVGQNKISLLDGQGGYAELPQDVLADLIKRGSLKILTPAASGGDPDGAAALLSRASPAALREATRRYRLIEPALQGLLSAEPTTLAARTRQRWLQQYRAAQATHGSGFLGLLPGQRGNTQPRLSEATRDLMNQCIADHYETLKQKGKFAVYGQFLMECERQGIQAASYKTFAAEINRRPSYEQTRKRAGARAAYVHEPRYEELTPTVPRHGERPFEIAHIDHTELDVELICVEPYRNLGRPWATFLTDAFSRRLLAVLLLYDPPSYRTNMMVLRECVRHHQRFPQTIVVDGGKDFHSLYLDALLAAQECTKRIRPAGKARFGSVIERLFGVSNQQFVHNLQGNTQLTKQVRRVTKAIAPTTQAIWTLPFLYERLCEWAYEHYDTQMHGRLEQSPRAACENGLRLAGERSHRMVRYDEAFRLLTLPTTRSGLAKVIPANGVKINNRYYWAQAMRDAAVENQRVPVRYDPYDMGQAYVFLHGAWVSCHSEHYQAFHGRTEREVMLASSELRKRQRHGTAAFHASAKKLAAFLTSVEAQEALMMQRLRDNEARKALSLMEGEKPSLPERLSLATEPSSAALIKAEAAALPASPAPTTQLDVPELYSDY